MFNFKCEQIEYDIKGIKIGGPPWRNPTVLIGTIFYEGHKIVHDWKSGVFDKEDVESLLKNLEELSDEHGNPTILDVFAGTPQAMINYLKYICDKTDFPFLIDSSDSETLITGSRYVEESGLALRAIYNSINYKTNEEELEELKKVNLSNVIIAATNVYNPTVEGRLELIKGNGEKKGLIEVAKEAGFKNILIDVSMLDAPDVGPASKTIYLIKDELGLPAGVGSTNFIELWKKGKSVKKEVYKICRAGGILFPVPVGADFIMYGPIEWAKDIYPLCSVFNSFMGYTVKLEGEKLNDNHPLTKFK